MRWIQKYDRLVLRDYPFFGIGIREIERHGRKHYEGDYMFPYPRKEFQTLAGAKNYFEVLLYKSFLGNERLIELVTSLKDFEAIEYIRVSHTLWCNNNGDGRYHPRGDGERWKRYQWIEGRFSITSAISKRYALRYDIAIPESKVKEHAVIIVKRHINRYMREYEK